MDAERTSGEKISENITKGMHVNACFTVFCGTLAYLTTGTGGGPEGTLGIVDNLWITC